MASDDEELQSLVIDNGSHFMRTGFAGDDAPRVVIPSMTVRARTNSLDDRILKKSSSSLSREDYAKAKILAVGDDAYRFALSSSGTSVRMPPNRTRRRNRQKDGENFVGSTSHHHQNQHIIESPFKDGHITDWDAIESLWHQSIYHEVQVDPNQSGGVIMTEKPFTMKAQREKMTQIMFETFEFPRFYLAIDGVLSMYCSGRTTGLAVDSGYDSTFVTPIYEGYTLPHATQRLFGLGGKTVDLFLEKLLLERGLLSASCASSSKCGFELLVRQIKESCCFLTSTGNSPILNEEEDFRLVAPFSENVRKCSDGSRNDGNENSTPLGFGTQTESKFTLPDNSLIDLQTCDARFLAPECLFFPRQLLNPSCEFAKMFLEKEKDKDLQNSSSSSSSSSYRLTKNNFMTTSEDFLKMLKVEAKNEIPFLYSAESDSEFIMGNLRNNPGGSFQFGMHHMIKTAYDRCEPDIQSDLIRNVVVSGGNTMFHNFGDRLQERLARLFTLEGDSRHTNSSNKNNINEKSKFFYNFGNNNSYRHRVPKVIAPQERKYSCWIGGSILGSLSTFESMWITQEEYDENGPAIVHRKCF